MNLMFYVGQSINSYFNFCETSYMSCYVVLYILSHEKKYVVWESSYTFIWSKSYIYEYIRLSVSNGLWRYTGYTGFFKILLIKATYLNNHIWEVENPYLTCGNEFKINIWQIRAVRKFKWYQFMNFVKKIILLIYWTRYYLIWSKICSSCKMMPHPILTVKYAYI